MNRSELVVEVEQLKANQRVLIDTIKELNSSNTDVLGILEVLGKDFLSRKTVSDKTDDVGVSYV